MKKGSIFTPTQGLFYGYITPVLTISLFVVLIGISVFTLIYRSNTSTAVLIDNDLHILVDAFERIDKDCRILDFDYTLNRINFLNVVTFVGSEVGPVNLSYPTNWKGPYIKDNPTIQEQEYLVVVTRKGYYITPGTGVKLPNGNVVGRDIKLDKDADIESMMKKGGLLYYNGKALAAKLNVGASALEQVIQEGLLPVEY